MSEPIPAHCPKCHHRITTLLVHCPNCGESFAPPVPIYVHIPILTVVTTILSVGACTFIPIGENAHLPGLTLLGGGPALLFLFIILSGLLIHHHRRHKFRELPDLPANPDAPASNYPRGLKRLIPPLSRAQRNAILLLSMVLAALTFLFTNSPAPLLQSTLGILAIIIALTGLLIRRDPE